jgi:formate dehydrogenase major subunit
MSRWNITQDDLNELKDLVSQYNAEEVSRISGVPVDLLRTVARIYVERSGVVTNHKKHGIIQWAMGFTQHTNATINIIRAAAIVQLLLGNVGFPGGGTHPFRGHSNVQGANDVQGSGIEALPGYHGREGLSFSGVYSVEQIPKMIPSTALLYATSTLEQAVLRLSFRGGL